MNQGSKVLTAILDGQQYSRLNADAAVVERGSTVYSGVARRSLFLGILTMADLSTELKKLPRTEYNKLIISGEALSSPELRKLPPVVYEVNSKAVVTYGLVKATLLNLI